MSSARRRYRVLIGLAGVVLRSCGFVPPPPTQGMRHLEAEPFRGPHRGDEPLGMATTRSEFLAGVLAVPLLAQDLTRRPLPDEDIPSRNETAAPMLPIQSEALQETLSGMIAGSTLTTVKSLVKYPLDTATVRLQMPNSIYSLRRPWELLDDSYRGVLLPLVAGVPSGAVFFGAKDACRAILRERQPGMPRWLATSIAVGVAQFPYWAVRNPSEVVKTRQQSGLGGFGRGVTILEAYRAVYNETDSLRSFYLGYWENILYAYPADVIKFALYEGLSGGSKQLTPLEGALAGAASTALAQLLTTPLDVVRNRIMARGSTTGRSRDEATAGPKPERQPSYFETLAMLGRNEGLKGLFAGATPRVGKALVSGAVQFATYEETKQQILAVFRDSVRQ